MNKKSLFQVILINILLLIILLSLTEVIVGIIYARYKKRILDEFENGKLLDYTDTRDRTLKGGGYLKANFRKWVIDGCGGKVWWETNAQGFRVKQNVTQKPESDTIRILSIGDSFTAGYRVGQGKTFSDYLEHWLNQEFTDYKIEVLISSTDNPADSLHYFQSIGVSFHPHVVLLGVTLGNDISGTFVRLDDKYGYQVNHEQNSRIILKKRTKRHLALGKSRKQ